MILAELAQYNDFTIAINQAPFTYKTFPASYIQADYWTNTFGCPDESITIQKYISSFVRRSLIFYSMMISLLDCIAQETSFFWNQVSEILYFHYEHDQCWWTDYYEYGTQLGFSDKDVVYIDNIKYRPLLKSVLSIAQQQDLVNYDKLSTITGDVIIQNREGILDELITANVYGNDFRLYYLDEIPDQYNYTRTDLISLASLFVDDYDFSLIEITARLQDKRLSQNIKIPTDVFTLADYPDIDEKYIGKIIPLIYGLIKSSIGIPIDGDAGSGNDVTFRQGLLLTSLGTVQVKIEDVWTIKTPTASDLTVGEFTLAEADGRNASGAPYECRILGSVGIENTYASDIILDLNNRFLNVPYIDSSYNRTEWAMEEIQLTTIGIIFDKSIELFEAIRIIQAQSNVGFRYEILPDGRRTIRIDDDERTPAYEHIPKELILNNNSLPISTDRDLLAAKVNVNYAYDYFDEYFQQVENDDYYADVIKNYRQYPTMEIETALTTQAHAEARALWNAERFHDIPKIIKLILMGKEFFTLRIYDILENVEITRMMIDAANGFILDNEREYYGIWDIQILSIDPDFQKLTNKITARLIEKKDFLDISETIYVRGTTNGAIRVLASNPSIKRGILWV